MHISNIILYLFYVFPFSEMRNVRGDDRLYVGIENSGYNFVKGLYKNRIGFDKEVEISIDGMRGTVFLSEDCVSDGGTLPSPVRGLPVRNNKVYWFVYIRYAISLKQTIICTEIL